ncbi:hypothetical protein [Lactococcus lactis]|uniref:hypothetical protein n=1 Tax=Lactococcus lactis TaxID=1358 RepID=UPI00223A927C|nr:hypothetical protein [Lactococcus lactis]
MNAKKIIIGTLVVSVLFATGFAVKADGALAPNVDVSKNGKVNLNIPKKADKIIMNTKKQVKYVVKGAVKLESTSGGNLTAPVTVDSQVTTDSGDNTKGVTTYTADLSQAQVISNDKASSDNNLAINILGNFFGTKVSATTYDTSTTSKWGSTYGVKIKEEIYWTVTGSHNDNKLNIYKVTGGYTIADSSIQVTSSSIRVQQKYHPSQDHTWGKGTSASWSVSTGYTAVSNTPGSRGEVGYTVNLKRGTHSKWSVTLNNLVFSY